MAEKEEKGEMTVSEAGHRGGGETARTHDHEFYEEIGHKGGEKVKGHNVAGLGECNKCS
jgi:general stress protein YciG